MYNYKSDRRVVWIDILKGIGIFFVVFVHTIRWDEPLAKYLSTFFMPFFCVFRIDVQIKGGAECR